MNLLKNQKIDGKLINYADFKFFLQENENKNLKVLPKFEKKLLSLAKEAMSEPIEALTASMYREFAKNGNRSNFEKVYFDRHKKALYLLFGLIISKDDSFLDSLIDIVWAILEETSWVLPAHNYPYLSTSFKPLPYEFEEKVTKIDLFSAETAALLGMIYYYCKDSFEEVLPEILNERILYELDRRIFRPFTECAESNWWSGQNPKVFLNNWTPWIALNVVTSAAACVSDMDKRTNIVNSAMFMLDRYLSFCKEDGSCEEGVGYFNVAGAALYTCFEVIYDMTGGEVNYMKDSYVMKMAEYAVKAHINDNQFLNFADCGRRVTLTPSMFYRWGKQSGSKLLCDFAIYLDDVYKDKDELFYTGMTYRTIYHTIYSMPESESEFKHEQAYYINNMQIMTARGKTKKGRDLFLAIKGGSNGEGHGHNDVGSFIAYVNNMPLFIDPGVEQYTRETFDSTKRYLIWTMRSIYHNIFSIDDIEQLAGGKYKATQVEANLDEKMLCMELVQAYPEDSKIISAKRCASISKNLSMEEEIVIEDKISLNDEKQLSFTLMSLSKPTKIASGQLSFTLEDGSSILCTYNSDFDYSIEEVEVLSPKLIKEWDAKKVYRNIFTKNTKEETFKITIKEK